MKPARIINAKVISSSPEGDREATPGPTRAREQMTRRDLPQKLPPFCQTWRWHATSDAHPGLAGRRAERLGGRLQAAAKRWARLEAKMSAAPRKAAGKAAAAMPVQPKTSSKTPEK